MRFYRGEVAVLVSRHTYSAAEIAAYVFQLSGRGKIIGSRTGKAVLPVLNLTLPDQGIVFLPVARFQGRDGRRLEGEGITPDLAVSFTREDLLEGRDPVIERALRLLNGDAAD